MPPIAILVALADPTRCRLIELLHAGPQPVHVLAAAFKISRPAISRHLRVLKQAGLISESKFGRENRYSLHPRKLAPVQRWLGKILPAPAEPHAAIAPVVEPQVLPPKPRPRKAQNARGSAMPVANPSQTVAAAAELKRPTPSRVAKTNAAPTGLSQMGFDF